MLTQAVDEWNLKEQFPELRDAAAHSNNPSDPIRSEDRKGFVTAATLFEADHRGRV